MGKYKLVIFDLDGTILDTLDDLADSTNYALKSCGLPTRTVDEVRRFVGNGIRNLIDRAVPEGTDLETAESVFETFKAYYKEHSADKTKPYEGVCRLMGQLRDDGCKVAVLSNKADFAVQDLCRDYFPGLVTYAAGEKDGVRRKPYPDAVFAVLEACGVSASEAVYVGDSEVDVATAANAGLDGISVTWGFRSREWLEEHGAKVFADTTEELRGLL
ncbi:MAG: HAD family hydrolase [Emergencia sp.]